MARWHSCNVFDPQPGRRRLWQFSVDKGLPAPIRDQSLGPDEFPPARRVARDWHMLFHRRLNLAWLPPENVFLRVVQLPAVNLAETTNMVELQLEKLSPLPVGQILWTLEVFPTRGESEELQTVIVVIVPRQTIEAYLGGLERQGYIADRLDLPFLDQLIATEPTADGAWIYPEPSAEPGNRRALVAWWYGGRLRNLALLRVPNSDQATGILHNELHQMAWAGDIEGWLTSSPRWHMVADEATAAEWLPLLSTVTEQQIDVIPPRPHEELAALSAERAVKADTATNLVPAEYVARYRQQYVDGLWMRGVGAVIALYMLGVLAYFGALQVLEYQHDQLRSQVAGLSQTYTNAIRNEARLGVLEERQRLKYGALQCWEAVARLLPTDAVLDDFRFQNGERLALRGTAPPGSAPALTDFNEALSKYTVDGHLLFTRVAPKFIEDARMVRWDFDCTLSEGDLR